MLAHLKVHHNHHGWGLWRIAAITIGGLALAVVFGFVFGWFVQLLWNWLMPSLFGLKAITFWQGFGLVVLAKLLFGSHSGHHGPGGPHHRQHHHSGHPCHKRPWDESEDDEMWKPKGSHRNWRYYEQYWKDEGKAAFEAYIERIQSKAGQSD
jgi:hypothetical protein